MGRSLVIEPLYSASLFRMKIEIKFDLLKKNLGFVEHIIKEICKNVFDICFLNMANSKG
jgi:malate/lactate dehydrogenase